MLSLRVLSLYLACEAAFDNGAADIKTDAWSVNHTKRTPAPCFRRHSLSLLTNLTPHSFPFSLSAMFFQILGFATDNIITSFTAVPSARSTIRSMNKHSSSIHLPNNSTASALTMLAGLSIIFGGLTPIIGLNNSPLSVLGITGSASWYVASSYILLLSNA